MSHQHSPARDAAPEQQGAPAPAAPHGDARGSLYDAAALERITAERRRWEKRTVEPAAKRVPERQDTFSTQSGMPVQRLYTSEDTANLDYQRDLGYPGEFPYTRGVQPTMYRAKPWTMRMFAGFGTAEETNERFKYLLSQGQTGLSVAFDMATLSRCRRLPIWRSCSTAYRSIP